MIIKHFPGILFPSFQPSLCHHLLTCNRHIIHRDLNPQTIAVCPNRTLSQKTLAPTSIEGTSLGMAPELVPEHPYTETIDV
jgi:serine/threonine protein kinase